jgi:hypothetical protein
MSPTVGGRDEGSIRTEASANPAMSSQICYRCWGWILSDTRHLCSRIKSVNLASNIAIPPPANCYFVYRGHCTALKAKSWKFFHRFRVASNKVYVDSSRLFSLNAVTNRFIYKCSPVRVLPKSLMYEWITQSSDELGWHMVTLWTETSSANRLDHFPCMKLRHPTTPTTVSLTFQNLLPPRQSNNTFQPHLLSIPVHGLIERLCDGWSQILNASRTVVLRSIDVPFSDGILFNDGIQDVNAPLRTHLHYYSIAVSSTRHDATKVVRILV